MDHPLTKKNVLNTDFIDLNHTSYFILSEIQDLLILQNHLLQISRKKNELAHLLKVFRSRVLFAKESLFVLVMVFSLLNIYFMVFARQKYSLMYSQKKPKRRSIRKITLKKQPEDKFVNEIDNQKFWEMCVWSPSTTTFIFFIAINPTNLIIIFYGKKIIFMNKILLLLSSSLSLMLLIGLFSGLIQDKKILNNELFNEYNKKFVHPKILVNKKDVMVDSTKGPVSSLVFMNVTPYMFTQLRNFVTHDLNGNRVITSPESVLNEKSKTNREEKTMNDFSCTNQNDNEEEIKYYTAPNSSRSVVNKNQKNEEA